MALRQLLSGKRQYIGSFLIAILLVFFASLIGRMNAWLGPNGEGLMDAFNPADLDLGVQIFSDLSRDEVEAVIHDFSPVADYYDLAITRDDPRIWCRHYFLEDSDKRIAVMNALEERYRADIHVHENACPGTT